MAHWTFRIEHDRRAVRAVCTCGWQSPSTGSAGIAGAMWDLHVEAVETGEAKAS